MAHRQWPSAGTPPPPPLGLGCIFIAFPSDRSSKGRGLQSGKCVATLTPVKYVGQFGVFADEPRAATLYCPDAVQAWASSKADFVRHVKALPAQVRGALQAGWGASRRRRSAPNESPAPKTRAVCPSLDFPLFYG